LGIVEKIGSASIIAVVGGDQWRGVKKTRDVFSHHADRSAPATGPIIPLATIASRKKGLSMTRTLSSDVFGRAT
jgi:hypothetical protein